MRLTKMPHRSHRYAFQVGFPIRVTRVVTNAQNSNSRQKPTVVSCMPSISRRRCLSHISILAATISLPLFTFAEQDLDQAASDFRKVTGLQDLAFELTNQQKFPQAEIIWTKLISLNDENAAAYSNRGNCRTSQGKFEEAISDFDNAIRIAPEEPDPYLGKGVALEGLKKFVDAIECYKNSNAKSKQRYGAEDPVALNNIGNAYGGLGEWEEALNNFTRAADMDSRFVFALANEALALYQVGKDEKGLQKMRFLVRKYPGFGDMHAALAVAAWDRGDTRVAEEEWFKVEKLDMR